jgi:hypothetical protein
MRTYHPIAVLTVICFCLAIAWHGLQAAQFSSEGFFTEATADTPREAYHARLEAQEAARKAAVERRRARLRAERHRRW